MFYKLTLTRGWLHGLWCHWNLQGTCLLVFDYLAIDKLRSHPLFLCRKLKWKAFDEDQGMVYEYSCQSSLSHYGQIDYWFPQFTWKMLFNKRG
jgi:hypothetical protein